MYAVGSKGTWWLSVGGSASLKNTAGVCGQDLQVLLTKPLLCWFSHYPFGDEYTKTTTLNPDGMFTICSLLEAPSQELLSCTILQSGPKVTGQEIGGLSCLLKIPSHSSSSFWSFISIFSQWGHADLTFSAFSPNASKNRNCLLFHFSLIQPTGFDWTLVVSAGYLYVGFVMLNCKHVFSKVLTWERPVLFGLRGYHQGNTGTQHHSCEFLSLVVSRTPWCCLFELQIICGQTWGYRSLR